MTRLRSRSSCTWFLVMSVPLVMSFTAATAEARSSEPILLAEQCNPLEPALAGLAGSGFVAAWITGSNTDEPGVRVRRWDRRGAATGREHFAPALAGEPSAPALTVSPSGGFAVVWANRERIRLWRFDARGEPRGLPVPIPGPVPSSTPRTRRPVGVAADGEAGFAVVWLTTRLHVARIDDDGGITRVDTPALGNFGTFGLQRFAVSFHPEGDLLLLQQIDPPNISPPRSFLTAFRIPLDDPQNKIFFKRDASSHSGVVLGVDNRGRTVVGWNDGAEVGYQRFGAELEPLTEPVPVATAPALGLPLEDLALALDREGNLVLAWVQRLERGDLLPIRARGIGADDTFLGPPRTVEVVNPRTPSLVLEDPRRPVLAVTGPGEVTASWSPEIRSHPLTPVQCTDSWVLAAQRFELAGGRALLLIEGRFRVEVEWQAPTLGTAGLGGARADTDDSGRFWFFDPANVELVTNVIDGRRVNGHFWFFYGALSNVGYRITVTDQRTGRTKTYDNPPGRLASFADTMAFPRGDPP